MYDKDLYAAYGYSLDESDAQTQRLLRDINRGLPRNLDILELAKLVKTVARTDQLVVVTYNTGDPDAILSVRQGYDFSEHPTVPSDDVVKASGKIYFFRLAKADRPGGPYMQQSVEQMMDPNWGSGRRVTAVGLMVDPR